jgi:3-hydroxyacyl-CoA dehydrogenase
MTAPASGRVSGPAPSPTIAIIGAGAIGRGWAALAVAHGWPVTVFDTDIAAGDAAMIEIAARARSLVSMGRAAPHLAEAGIATLQAGTSLLQVCEAADWVIESIGEDLAQKQRLFENLEGLAQRAAVISSSSGGLPMTEIGARCRDQKRLIIVHPLNPPELIPLVEVVPGKFTAPQTVDMASSWLRSLGRIPIALKREVPGNVVGRVAAAMYRECIDLVLTGVVDVDQVDRAVSLGPSLGWAAAGPHLTYHLGAGERGLSAFLQGLLQSFETWWGSLAQWTKLEPEQVKALTAQVEKSYGNKLEDIREARDRRLASFLKALETSRRPSEIARTR